MIPKSVVSDWMTVSQEQIQMFADATCDQQWIHVDPARAQRESSFGGTIAHGFLTLSLIGALLRKTESLDGFRMSVNYGLNRVRFTAPVLSGSRVRGRFVAASVEEKD
ncbi:MAG TPA: MaoC family dehydratase, partial [Thermoanaerobaculia bacterium]